VLIVYSPRVHSWIMRRSKPQQPVE